MYRPHKPLHCRASLSPPYSQVGLAIDSPKPLLNLESKRPRGPDEPAPKIVRDLLNEIVVFFAPFKTLARRISAVTAPVAPLIQMLETVRKHVALRQLTRHN